MASGILTLGESMVAISVAAALEVSSQATLSIAGAESNVAIGLSRLGHRVDFASRVGDDQLGALIRRTLSAERVGVQNVLTDLSAPTGAIFFDRAPGGGSRVDYLRKSSAFCQLAIEHTASIDVAAYVLVHLTGITLALSEQARAVSLNLARRAVAAGAGVSFDINHRSRLLSREDSAANVAALLPMVRILIASEDELALVTGNVNSTLDEAALIDYCLNLGVEEVVVKRGEQGASVYTAEDQAHVGAHRVQVVNVIGAGDAFCAGYLSATLDGERLAERISRGNTLGACAVVSMGDWQGLPTRAELNGLDFDTEQVQR